MAERDFLLDIRFAPEKEEEVRAVLYLAGSGGDFEQGGVLTAFFDSAETREAARVALQDLASVELEGREQLREDWLEHYQQSLRALSIGKRFLVTPDLSLVEESGERFVLHIPQERAFGTGSHESTALCLEMLESLDLGGVTGVDVGTGSGILAIAMLQLGASKIVAFDNDPEITGVIHRNIRRNGVQRSQAGVFVGGVEAVRSLTADVIVMNILPEVILPLLPTVTRWLRPRGHLIVSGILTTRAEEVIAGAASSSLELRGDTSRGEWWCGLLSN